MRLRSLVARGYRNLADLEREMPPRGVALLGANAQGKTNLLEAICYPVLFRSFRGSPDQEVIGDGSGFHVEVRVRRQGAERRDYLDRLLSLASRHYLRALTRDPAALAQRNSALRQGRTDVAQAFDGALAGPGAELVQARLTWLVEAAEQFAAEFECLGESGSAQLQYRGGVELVEQAAWERALAAALPEDRARGMTTIGPHRDDLLLDIGGRRLRDYGSTGQQRSAAVALKLIEISALREARGTEPALLLDDVFAELDRERQTRLALRLFGPADRQVLVTSPRRDELPPNLDLAVWEIEGGRIR